MSAVNLAPESFQNVLAKGAAPSTRPLRRWRRTSR